MINLQERVQRDLGGRYAVERELGQGGMAVVFLADDLRHDRRVALKVLRPEISAEIGAERFAREIRMAAGLTHPHILPLHDSGEAGGLLFYVMPYMEGKSLRQRLDKERQLPIPDALRIAREVASALDYAHRHQIVHRDIKPENILLHESAALVADFGIGKALTGESITRTGLLIGTPAYMSPEQASGDLPVDGRSDLYSLGCVLYEMLAGEPPYTGATAQAIMSKRLSAPVPKVGTLRDVSADLEAVVTRLLARLAVDRYGTAADLVDALRGAAEDRPAARRTPPDGSTRGAHAHKSIAVLPFANMSADPENEYFSDGMTEEIINALAKVQGVQVASRTSSFAFKGRRDVDVREIGEKLGVSSVLEGSVRKVGNRIRIATQLVKAENGYHLWSDTFDRQLEDVFAIQDEISRAIVDALKVQLGGGEAHLVAPTKNIEAYTTYLKGRYNFNKFTEQGLRKSLELFQSALLQDPDFARAYSGIADAWINLADDWVAPDDGYPRAKGAAERALQRDPELAEAMTSLGKVLVWYEWKFAAGVAQLERAVALGPSYAEAHFVLGTSLPIVGRLADGIETIRRALALDPLSVHHSGWLARFFLYAKDYAAAIAQGERTLELQDEYQRAFIYVGSAYLAQGEAETALEWFQRGQALERAVRSYDTFIVSALAALGRREEAEAIMTRLEEESRHQYIRGEYLAMGYAALGGFDKAFEALERAYQARSSGLIYMHLDPGYEPLRPDPRYRSLVQRIGLK